ncbi:MAG: DinB family protein [Sporocytophaga sp.]|uniref:DinB family protein n=1 Tax=Sporocytophaga sp. TaxID=2231183 RepID=UPI001B21C086|nr:DinB family protein [Sporocytophaga sp.]MBO9702100.1 DinB family protein [Sporocytophaga sp.]
MNQVEILLKQTEETYSWVNRLIGSIPYEKWDITPEVIESNFSWQAGHLLMSFYFHSVMVIAGHQMDIIRQIPLKDYDEIFTTGKPENTVGKFKPDQLMKQLMLVELKSLEIIKSLSDHDLSGALYPSPVLHPIASNKLEALDWNIKHAMWHCGQLGILKRIVHERFDFGLKRNG